MSQRDPSEFDRLKARYKRFYARLTCYEKTCESLGIPDLARRIPDLPADLRGLTCGARTKRTGAPCKSTAIYRCGRCKFHGGLSTGPITDAGKAASALNAKKGGRPRKNYGMPTRLTVPVPKI